MVEFTPPLTPPLLIGLKIHPEHPMKFDFLLDRGDVNQLNGEELENESTRLIKYFLAALTVPAKDVWVNLSPYEKERIVSPEFGLTEMGRDLLGQDYLLKQLMASLTYPEKGLGKTFWDRVYKKAFELYGTTNIPLNTFNKVWIIPDSAEVFEKNDTAFIVNSHLKVMLEEDYLALKQNMTNQKLGTDKLEGAKVQQISNVSSGVVKGVLLPEIEREVNEGKNFALLRQIYNSLILAIWYKKRLKDSLLGQVYVDKSKVKGVDASDPNVKEKIYQQYIEAFKQGVYNYIKEDYDPYMQKNIPRKYFSGGFEVPQEFEDNGEEIVLNDPAMLSTSGEEHYERIKQEIAKGKKGNDVVIQTQVAELRENTTIFGIKQAQDRILKWFDKRNEEFRKKKGNEGKEPEPIPFTIDDLVQAGLGEKDILQAALNNLKERGLVFHRVEAVGKEWGGKSWVHRFGISAASLGEFDESKSKTQHDAAMLTQDHLWDNPAMRNFAERGEMERQYVNGAIRRFIVPDHDLKKEIFAKIDQMSDDEIIREINEKLQLPHGDKRALNLYRHWSIRQLFLLPTEGVEDLAQAFTGITFYEPEIIDAMLSKGDNVKFYIESQYMLIRAVEILSRTPDLFRAEDVSETSSLFQYLVTASVLERDGVYPFVQGFFSFSSLLIAQLLDRENIYNVNVDQLAEAMSRPDKQINRESIKNFIALLDLLKEKSEPWRKEMTRRLRNDEIDVQDYRRNITMLREALRRTEKPWDEEEVVNWIKNNPRLKFNVPFTARGIVGRLHNEGIEITEDLAKEAINRLEQRNTIIKKLDSDGKYRGRWILVEGLAGDNQTNILRQAESKAPQSQLILGSEGNLSYQKRGLTLTFSPHAEAKERIDIMQLLEEVLTRHLGYLPVIALTGSASYLPDRWNLIEDLDIVIYGNERLSFDRQQEIKLDYLKELIRAGFEGDYVVTNVGEENEIEHQITLSFARNPMGTKTEIGGEGLFAYKPTDIFFGDIEKVNTFLNSLGIEGIIETWLDSYQGRWQEIRDNPIHLGLKGVKRLYLLAAMRGKEQQYHWLLEAYERLEKKQKGPLTDADVEEIKTEYSEIFQQVQEGLGISNKAVIKAEMKARFINMSPLESIDGIAGDNIGVALRQQPRETKTSPDYGGIDLTAVESNLQIKRDENGVPLPLPLQNIQNIHLDGLKFIILNTAPASFNDFPFLISLKDRELSVSGN